MTVDQEIRAKAFELAIQRAQLMLLTMISNGERYAEIDTPRDEPFAEWSALTHWAHEFEKEIRNPEKFLP